MPITIDLIVVVLISFFAAIQVFYYLFFFLRLSLHKTNNAHGTTFEPVSIVISAFNEEANLKKNISNWLEQDYHVNGKAFFEVVVVNDNSEDDSFYFLNVTKQKYAHLRVVNLTQEAKMIPGKKFPLSMGIKAAQYENLLLTDADCVPASNQWLKHMVDRVVSKQIVLGYAPYYKESEWLNTCIRYETAHSAMQYLSYSLASIPYMGVGRNLLYKKELFNKNKGFSSHHHIASGDDDLFINQVANSSNTTICLHPESFVYSDPKKTKLDWRFQKKRHLSTGKYYQWKHKFLLATYAFSHFFFWMSIIPALVYPKYLLYSVCIFCFRWLLQYVIFQSIFSKLKEKDLIPYIWLFDIWQLFYHVRSIPSIFFKSTNQWR